MSQMFFVLGILFAALSLFNLFGAGFNLPDAFRTIGGRDETARRLRSFFFALIALLMFHMAESAASGHDGLSLERVGLKTTHALRSRNDFRIPPT